MGFVEVGEGVEETDQLAQRVAALSWILRDEMCWQGRQEMRAVIVDEGAGGGDAGFDSP